MNDKKLLKLDEKIQWDKVINEFKKNHKDVALHTPLEEDIAKVLRQRSKNFNTLKKLIEKENEKPSKSRQSLLKKIPPSLVNEIGLTPKMDTKTLLYKCTKFIKTSINITCVQGKNFNYSKPRLYIARLAWIFHAITGKRPTCYYSEAKGRYRGNLYNFLIYAKPILEKLGINLGPDTTVAEYAKAIWIEHRNMLACLDIDEPILE